MGPPPRTVRLFPNSPQQQSVVDQVVFGRDMDFSGETQFDEEFTHMFQGSAGRPSWVTPTPRARGPKPAFRANSVRSVNNSVGTVDVVQKWARRSCSARDHRSSMVARNSPAGVRDAAAEARKLRNSSRALVSPRRGFSQL